LIQKLFKEGKSFSNFPLRAIYLTVENQDAPLKASFAVSTKYFKKAVDRNRVKRLMRESYRLQKHKLADELTRLDNQLAVFFIYTSSDLPNYKSIFDKLGNTLEGIKKSVSPKIKN
jgi:ribonuclease P protein component